MNLSRGLEQIFEFVFSVVTEGKKIRPSDAFVTSEGHFPYTRVHIGAQRRYDVYVRLAPFISIGILENYVTMLQRLKNACFQGFLP